MHSIVIVFLIKSSTRNADKEDNVAVKGAATTSFLNTRL